MKSPAPVDSRRRQSAVRTVSIFGATGSVGTSVADVILQRRGEFEVDVVTARSRVEELAAVARRLGARLAVIDDPSRLDALREALAGSGIEAAAGSAAMIEAASRPVDLVVAAVVGAAGLAPALAAVEAGIDVALANKECLVCAGELFMARAEAAGIRILPVDSEHNAIFQALEAENAQAVETITLTASGGPFRSWPEEAMRRATIADALKHPRWSMGPKITIDSATMMNKGLEVIEAHHLFAVESARLDVLVHPQSVVHGFITYCDGSILAQLGAADMRIPIAHCLGWPSRGAVATPRLDLAAVGSLTFEKPDLQRFPALSLARYALESGSWATNILNAANEVAVDSFLGGEIAFLDIASIVAESLDAAAGSLGGSAIASIDAALVMDAEGRRIAREAIGHRLRIRVG
ncbi:1-deoxy-D-xylulose-5-phosphate reductoisomerase [Kaistia algarum]|uniref:1-deoxy-D-xylulose-5-phosphate reductoisomerase n=1 Tax=Kaistia algarum TaxID=2083279 RepID=UPI000CE8B6E9|nr:1-deoxy-D-xylulose-5-phosphate reductoisomerase [Kaistia algarum]MCX5515302.1 1-deoxy-D-xylulose-5-phosphate reductoisomerase [Kaistia algarum]PPE77720.1 1-deoxy-D-xylulose-5-phosphate reductoisomerase [Kaistia algarum]